MATTAPAPVPVSENEKSVEPPVINEPETKATADSLDPLVKVRTAIEQEEAKTGKKFVPFLVPAPQSKPPPRTELTPDQQKQYEEVLAHCNAIETLPVACENSTENRPLDETERIWLTKECILRYLRACKWDVSAAKKRIEATLVWRRDWGVLKHTSDYISVENETGKQVILGYDNECRPCLYLNPARQNTERSDRQIQHLVYMLERVIDLMPPGQETLALLVDFKSSSKNSNPSIAQARLVLNILQNHYPERLGRALVINVPFFIWGFFKLINPFIDPLTREKLKFNENLRDHIPAEQLDKKFGGDVEFEYEHSKFWPELTRLAGEKNAAYTARWRAAGSKIGASEVELKGGDSTGLASAVQNLEVKS